MSYQDLIADGFPVSRRELDLKPGGYTAEEMANSTSKGPETLLLGAFGPYENCYLIAINLVIGKVSRQIEARHYLEERFYQEIDFSRLPYVKASGISPSRQYIALCDEPIDSVTLYTSPETGFQNGREIPEYEIRISGSDKTVTLPPFASLEWGQGLDPNSLQILKASSIRRAAGKARPGEEFHRVRRPRLHITSSEIEADLADLPAKWVDVEQDWIKVGKALHHESQGSLGALRTFQAWTEQNRTRADDPDADKIEAENRRARCAQVWRSFRGEGGTTWSWVKRQIRTHFALERCKALILAAADYAEARDSVARYDLTPVAQSTVIGLLLVRARADELDASRIEIKKELQGARDAYTRAHSVKSVETIEDAILQETIRTRFNDGKHIVLNGKALRTYQGGVWRDREDGVTPEILETIRSLYASIGSSEDDGLVSAIRSSNRVDRTMQLADSVNSLVKVHMGLTKVDDPAGLMRTFEVPAFNLQDCELWFDRETRKFVKRPHKAEHMFGIQLRVKYDPAATCPTWDRVALELFEGHDDPADIVRHLEECMGYTAQMRRILKMWMLHFGDGNNGKSLLMRVLAYILGEHVVAKPVSEFNKQDDQRGRFQLIDKLAAWEDDFEKGEMLPGRALKTLANPNALLDGRDLYSSPVNFVNRAVPVIMANDWPQTNDLSHGMAMRAQVFRYLKTFSGNGDDLTLFQTMIDHELPGILNRLVAGAERLFARGHLDVPEACEAAKSDWLGQRSSVAAFLTEEVKVTGNPNDTVLMSHVYRRYQDAMQDQGITKTVAYKALLNEVRRVKGVEIVPDHKQAALKNVVLKIAPRPAETGQKTPAGARRMAPNGPPGQAIRH